MSNNQKYVIEHGVPIPERHGNCDSDSLAGTMRRMKAGDSIFFLPPPGKTILQQRGHVYASARIIRIREKSPAKFTIKTEGEGIRVWRVQ